MDFQQLYWLIEYGFPKRKISPDTLLQNPEVMGSPVFFLSTGRCGTQWFANLFKGHKEVKSFHAPKPDLALQNVFAYQIQQKSTYSENEIFDILSNIFFAGRQEYLRYSYKTKRRYIETNNHITFFAPVLAKLFPQAKFVHIVRHPGEFVSSGLKRFWYDVNNNNQRQIVPVKGKPANLWQEYSRVEKASWLWTATNEYIEVFKAQVNPTRIITIDFSRKKIEDIEKLYNHLDVHYSKKRITKMFNKKMNFQTYNQTEKYQYWPKQERADLKRICESLALKYNYNL